jgi:dihydrofolate reductase
MTMSDKPLLKIIVAMDLAGVIGRENQIPWKIRTDLKRFRDLTEGHTIIMGRKTCESIASYAKGPLKGRRNIVLSRNKSFSVEGFERVSDWDAFMDKFERDEYGDVYVIGGAEIYKKALLDADFIYITYVCAIINGDTFFPEFEEANWRVAERSPIHPISEFDQFEFYYEVLERIKTQK